MAEDLLSVQIAEHAEIVYSTLGQEDRRLVDAWCDHLRNWRNDEFIRSRSRRLASDQEMYAFQTSTDIVLVFEISGNKVTVLSIFREEALRSFETMAEHRVA
jgi:hypothetical protein